jgi:aminoglycoside phosphotransferase (APT) family kinase protein
MSPSVDPGEHIAALAQGFELPGPLRSVERVGRGRIHHTYVAAYGAGEPVRLVHQRLNRTVFPQLGAVMENVLRVTEHLHCRLVAAGASDLARRSLRVVPTREGRAYWIDPWGDAWRSYHFVADTLCHETALTPAVAFEAARAFGEFLALLADLPGPRLAETIPEFHHTPRRLAALDRAARADRVGRTGTVEAELAFISSRRARVGRLIDLAAANGLPERVVHNDTKLNNVLFDAATGKALCVVDLDTVMPGLAPYDFGDLVRSALLPAGEEASGAILVERRLPIFQALVEGYITGAGAILTEAEVAEFGHAGGLIALELAARFLTDHLEGDRYFAVSVSGQNLERCRRQLRLVAELERHAGTLTRVVERVWVRRARAVDPRVDARRSP